jgi:SAM-dependent methyltransferase
MFWPWEIIERDHEIQNPLNPAKILLLGDYLRLTSDSRVLDVACGKCGPASILAATYECRILGIEKNAGFADEARARLAASGLDSLVEVQTADASNVHVEPESFDAALCLGASFVWGTMVEAAPALYEVVRPGGFAAIGEPFWHEWPLPPGVPGEGYVDLIGTVNRFEQPGLALTGIIASSQDDWDHYESLHWRAIEEWLAEHPDHEGSESMRERHEHYRREYLRGQRGLMRWAIFVGRKS